MESTWNREDQLELQRRERRKRGVRKEGERKRRKKGWRKAFKKQHDLKLCGQRSAFTEIELSLHQSGLFLEKNGERRRNGGADLREK